MATSVRKLEIRIDQTGNAQKGIQGLISSLGPAGIAAAAAATAIAAIGAVAIAVGAKLVMLGSDAFEMEGKFNVVFGEGAADARKALEDLGDEVGRSTFELEEMAASVQDTFVPMGFARDEAAKLSLGLTELAVDVGSFNNAQDVDVMRDFQSALVGNHETVRKYGIVITQATLDQELLTMGVEGGIKAATEQEKVQARLNVIYAGTTDAHGDAARTAGSFANQMRGLKATVSEAATALGLELLPYVTPILQMIGQLATTSLPKAIEVFRQLSARLREELGPVMIQVRDAIARITDALGLEEGGIQLVKIAIGALVVGLEVFIVAVKLVAGFIEGVSRALETARGIIDAAKQSWDRFAGGIRGVGNAINSLIRRFGDLIRKAQEAARAIPKWLRPGSPTPFEIGLRGIGGAMKDVGDEFGNMASVNFSPTLAGATASGRGGAPIIVNLTYAPAFSMANEFELENKLAPFIERGVRAGLEGR